MATIGSSYVTLSDLIGQPLSVVDHDIDPSAFWLYPDWDGPIKEPFWMRPLKLPVITSVQTRMDVEGQQHLEVGTSSIDVRPYLRPSVSQSAWPQSERRRRLLAIQGLAP